MYWYMESASNRLCSKLIVVQYMWNVAETGFKCDICTQHEVMKLQMLEIQTAATVDGGRRVGTSPAVSPQQRAHTAPQQSAL